MAVRAGLAGTLAGAGSRLDHGFTGIFAPELGIGGLADLDFGHKIGSIPACSAGMDPRGVEMGRIELPSDVALSGLLRAQFASVFLSPSYLANK